MLTDTDNLSAPSFSSIIMNSSACLIIFLLKATISCFSSATGMNSLGGTLPSISELNLARVSNPAILSSDNLTIGWNIANSLFFSSPYDILASSSSIIVFLIIFFSISVLKNINEKTWEVSAFSAAIEAFLITISPSAIKESNSYTPMLPPTILVMNFLYIIAEILLHILTSSCLSSYPFIYNTNLSIDIWKIWQLFVHISLNCVDNSFIISSAYA